MPKLIVGFKGILFDFDGTLADTMEGHYLAWKAALQEHGITIREEDYYPLEGMGLHEVARLFTRSYHWSEDQVDELVRKKKQYYVKSARFDLYPGVQSLIARLHQKKVPMGIVTAGHLDQLQQSVPAPFLDCFDTLITGDQLKKGKPDPEPYLKGVRKLGLQPQECIAVENAPIGVRSAKQANTYCIAVCSTVSRGELSEADEIVKNFSGLSQSEAIGMILE